MGGHHKYVEPTTGIEPVNLILTKDVLYLLSYVGRTVTPHQRFLLYHLTLVPGV